jgi:hypothetical protein
MSEKMLASFQMYAEKTNVNWLEAAIEETSLWKVI